MNRWKRVASGLVGLACAGLIFVGCSESSAAPTESSETAIPQFVKLNCLAWSCAIGTCGYNTAHDPGACCVSYGTAAAIPKPNCNCPGGLPANC
jgi:hypothetical protein